MRKVSPLRTLEPNPSDEPDNNSEVLMFDEDTQAVVAPVMACTPFR